jgi:hypothetical protein
MNERKTTFRKHYLEVPALGEEILRATRLAIASLNKVGGYESQQKEKTADERKKDNISKTLS